MSELGLISIKLIRKKIVLSAIQWQLADKKQHNFFPDHRMHRLCAWLHRPNIVPQSMYVLFWGTGLKQAYFYGINR